MKRLLKGALAALMLALLLAGCVPGEKESEVDRLVSLTTEGKEAVCNPDSEIQIGVVMAALDNNGWIAIFNGIIDEAMQQDVGVTCYSANNDPDRQVNMINNLITMGVDGIIFIPTNSEWLSAPIHAAQSSGIPIVAADRSVVNAVPDALVESDNIQIGKTAAQQMASASGGRELRVLVLQGDLMTSAGYERDRGFRQEIRNYDNCVVAASAKTLWKADLGYQAVLEALSTDPSINAIYLPSDLYTQGTVAALEIMGRLKPIGDPEHVVIVSVDGHPVGLENIRKQYIDIDVGQRLYSVGQKAMKNCILLAMGEKPDQLIVRMQPQVISQDNVDSAALWANFIE